MWASGLQADIFGSLEKNFREWVTTSRNRSSRRRRPLATSTSASGCSAWSTPQAHDVTARGKGQTYEANGAGNRCLNNEAQAWATPNVCERGPESKEIKEKRGSGGIDLMTQVQGWPPPKARDHKGMSQRGIHAPGDALENSAQVFACPSAHQDATTTADGLGSLLKVWTRPSSPRLSPAFQWWLMRMPHPQAIYSASAATEWTHWLSQMRSCVRGLASLARRIEA